LKKAAKTFTRLTPGLSASEVHKWFGPFFKKITVLLNRIRLSEECVIDLTTIVLTDYGRRLGNTTGAETFHCTSDGVFTATRQRQPGPNCFI
jgi:hypothetical protein